MPPQRRVRYPFAFHAELGQSFFGCEQIARAAQHVGNVIDLALLARCVDEGIRIEPMPREVVAPLAIGVNEIEPHVLDGVPCRRCRVIRINRDVVGAINSERLRDVERAGIERWRVGGLRRAMRSCGSVGCLIRYWNSPSFSGSRFVTMYSPAAE